MRFPKLSRPALTVALCAGAAAVLTPAVVAAHFALLAPVSWLVEDQRGDPQKAAPCGGITGNPGTPSGVIGTARGGDILPIRVKETIYHPGYYRVALSVLDRKELPADPEAVTREGPRGPISVSGKVDPNPKPPVLADGMFMHHEAPKPGEIYEGQVRLPNINCEKCTIQVIQFMENHGLNRDGDFTYHHCADVRITANPALPIDRAWPGQTAAAPARGARPKGKL